MGGLYLAVAVLWIVSMPTSLGADLLLLSRAAARLMAGLPLYPDPAGLAFAIVDQDSFYGPPALAVLAVPLTAFGESAIRLLAFPVGWALVALSFGVLARAVRLRRDQVAAGFIGLVLSFSVFGSATLGASSLIVLVSVSGAAVALVRGRDSAAGLLIGTAAALRLYPLVLLLPLLAARRWRAIAWAGASIAAWTLLGVLVAGPEMTRDYVDLTVRLAGAEGGTSNVAPAGILRPVSVAYGALLLVLAGLGIRRREGAEMVTLWWALALAGMLLVAPIVWDHYLTTLIPLVVGLMARLGRAWPGLLSAGLTTAAWSGGFAIAWLPAIGLAAALRAGASREPQRPPGQQDVRAIPDR